jgi:hypothetical protein
MSLTKVSYSMINSAPVSVLDFGAVGNGVVDDTAAIQAALDYAGANGGGTVVLPMVGATGRYRTTSVLRIPNYVTLEGTNPLVFPFDFNNGILADFTNVNQWVIESKTTSGGNYIPYNTVLTSFPDGATYNCGIRNLRIAATNTVPFGGVRMQGSFGPIVENVAIAGVGCGFLLNESLGGKWSVNARCLYYGMAIWNDCNANEISLYTTQSPQVTSVPSGYQLPFMTSLNGQLIPTYNLPSNDPYAWSSGLIVGADIALTSQTNTINATIETFSNAVFLINTKSVTFTNLYIEGGTNDVKYGLTAANATANILGTHAFMSGSGTMFAIGNDSRCNVTLNGIPFFATFGTVYVNSNLMVYNFSDPTPLTPALNVAFASQTTAFNALALVNSWANVGGTNATAGYRKNQKSDCIELKGYVTGGSTGTVAFTLPAGCRPTEKRNFAVAGGNAEVLANGTVILNGTTLGLDGIIFLAQQ